MNQVARRLVFSALALTAALTVALPASASTPISCTNRHGGNGGGSYFTGWTTGAHLAEIIVWHGNNGFGNVINGIEPVWCYWRSEDQIACELDQIGRMVGTRSSFQINWSGGERITAIQGRSGKYLDAIQFYTNTGRLSSWFGGQGGGFFIDWAPNGTFFNDFWGTSGQVVDSAGFCALQD
jgi:hypothetical protein